MKISNLPARKATLAEVHEQFETWWKNRGKKKVEIGVSPKAPMKAGNE
jgi:hypothetical protein